MSKDANNSVAAGNETRNALLVGLLLIPLLILVPLYSVERAQQDLTERSREALRSQGLDPSAFEIDFDGRDARLAGDRTQATELDQARRVVQQVWGVRTVSTRTPSSSGVAPARARGVVATASEAAGPALGGEPPLGAPSDATPPAPDGASPAQAVAPAEPSGGKSLEPAVARAPVTSRPRQVAEATAPPAPQPTAPVSAPSASAPTVAEAAAPPPPAGPATGQPRPQPLDTTRIRLADPEVQPGPETGVPGVTGQQIATKAQTPAPDREPTDQPGAAGPGAAAATAEMQTPGRPAAPAQVDATLAPELKAPAPERVKPEASAGSTPAPEAPVAVEAADGDTREAAGAISTETLLIDWPDLAAVEDLRLELQQDQVWLRGRVNSLADLQRIEDQFPDSAAGRHVRLDLRLAERSSQELSDYLNLVAASFRFRAGTSHFGPAGERAMDRIADTLKSYPGMRLGLAGRAPETIKPRVRRVHARHRAGATYRALLKRGVDSRQLFLADFASPFSPLLGRVPVAPGDPGQIRFFSLER